jgi:hypothetical protein
MTFDHNPAKSDGVINDSINYEGIYKEPSLRGATSHDCSLFIFRRLIVIECGRYLSASCCVPARQDFALCIDSNLILQQKTLIDTCPVLTMPHTRCLNRLLNVKSKAEALLFVIFFYCKIHKNANHTLLDT